MSCDIECISTYSCHGAEDILGSGSIQAFPGTIYAPYVQLNIGEDTITVGNESSPGYNNLASISSFQYGFGVGTVGWGCEIEIIDVGGMTYRKIILALNKTIANTQHEANLITFDFGWIIRDCFGNTSISTATSLTGFHLRGFISEVHQTFEGGLIKFKLKLNAAGAVTGEAPQNDTIGESSNKVNLKEAIRLLHTEKQPAYNGVIFRSKDDDGTGGFEELQFKNSDGGANGPNGVWPMNQQNNLAATRTWLGSIVTNNERGILLIYDPDEYSLICQEDVQENLCCTNRNLGTYIVNGGNCSPVLDFSPNIQWFPTGGPGAVSGGADSGSYTENRELEDVQHAGPQTSPTIQQHEREFRSEDDLTSAAAEGIFAHNAANSVYETPRSPISAQLKIHGDPIYCYGPNLIGSTISIVVINPFHLGNSYTNGDCIWISQPSCNSILSNKNYLIKGISHQITGGSFTTTLEVILAAPNAELPADETLGGCGTETFDDEIGASENKPAADI